jgi:hypothetical protein
MRFWQEVDGALVRLAASKADKVRDALANSINAQQVADDFLRAHPADTKITSAQARDWARLHVIAKTLPLLSAIREAYAEAYALGTDAAVAAYAHARLSKAATPSSDDLRASLQFDWSKWKPGNRAASLLLSPPSGLKGLLSGAGQTIKGMTDTSLNRVGTILGDALARGKGSDAAARTLITDGINGMITSASRAQTIAVTEMARATQIAQMDNYKSFGVEYVEWVDIDADDDCATNAEQGPIPIGETFDSGDTEPPAHPNCRCAIVPAFPDDTELPPLDETPSETLEEPTDHSDAIAQGLEALATELHPDMAVETTGVEAASEILDGKSIRTIDESNQQIWQRIIEDKTNLDYKKDVVNGREAAMQLKHSAESNLVNALLEKQFDIRDIGTAGRVDSKTIESFLSPKDNYGYDQYVRVSKDGLSGYVGTFEKNEIDTANPNTTIFDYKNLTSEQIQATLDYLNAQDKDANYVLPNSAEAQKQIANQAAKSLISNWAQTSNNENPWSLAFQEIALEHFGLQGASAWQIDERLANQVNNLKTTFGEIYKTILQAQYDATQKFFTDNAIKEVTVYRGVTSLGEKLNIGTNADAVIQARPLSSFTTDPQQAIRFAGDNGAVIAINLSVDKMLSLPSTGFGVLSCQEIVALGGELSAATTPTANFTQWLIENSNANPIDFWNTK